MIDRTSRSASRRLTLTRSGLIKIGYMVAGILVFIFALQVTKEGAAAAAPLVRDTFAITNPINALGFGWLFAYLVMSGSPVAAAGLTLLTTDAITPIETFTMISGSRLGSSLMVLLLGFIYVIRGAERRAGLSVGLLSMICTASLHIPTLIIGWIALQQGFGADWDIQLSALDVIDRIYAPLVDPLVDLLPGLASFIVGVLAIICAFSLIDRGLPEIKLEERGLQSTARLLYRPSVMFALGLVITIVTLSVSVSLGILVPLSARGLIRRENLIPYIMGCNVTTFIDTLVVALLLNSSSGVAIVLTQIISVSIVALTILFTFYPTYERVVTGTVNWMLETNRNFAIVMGVLVIVPIACLLV